MTQQSGKPPQRVSFSLPVLSYIVLGVGLLIVYWKFQITLRQYGVATQLGLLVLGLLLSCIGLIQGLQGKLLVRSEQKRTSVRQVSGKPKIQIADVLALFPWQGLFLLLGGGVLLIYLQMKDVSKTVAVLGMGLGGISLVFGFFLIAKRILVPPPRRQKGKNRVSLPIPGLIFLFMMGLLFVGTLQGHSNMMMLVFAMMAGSFVLNGWTTFSMLKKSQIGREVPSHAMAGQLFSVEVSCENKKRFFSNWLVDVTDSITGYGEYISAGVLFSRIPSGEKLSHFYHLRLMHRGEYSFGPLTASSRFPLGFVERGAEYDISDEIIVYPRLGHISPLWKREFLSAAELVERTNTKRGVYDDEFHHIREYRSGDNQRAIHWRTSARKNELMVREFHQSREPDLMVFLDLWRSEDPSESEIEEIEQAISFTATLCVEQMTQSRESTVRLFCLGQEKRLWEGQSGPASFDSLLSLLALFEAGRSDSLGADLEEGLAKKRTGDFTVLVTTRPDAKSILEDITQSAGSTMTRHLSDLQIVRTQPSELSRYFSLQ